MQINLFNWLSNKFDRFLERHFPKISEINRKYSKPKIQMDFWVRVSLLLLRLYLVFLILIMAYKFYLLVMG